ncbi:DUF3572 domain-containing protein [Pseudaestuariivita rosea]|uniref:DUF3572 domain-containing protein n=1 Tax=Pseudaestuariivita rosea TaxID=2763263 RepID=UPI001F3920C0|nr:DUF3572 domain-containing protein [Pseudaestuariivita rosea]
MRRDYAETVALKALSWLVGNDELMPVFMGATGVSESDMRQRATEPEFLASVLDFLMMDDRWVTEFCDAEQLPYEDIIRVRSALPGGEQMHWT